MGVEHKFGFVVEVPEDNGYDRNSFKERAVPHVKQTSGAKLHVPMFSEIVEGEETKVVDDKVFGVMGEVSAEWWDDAYRRHDIAKKIIEGHYGLKVKPASFRYENGGIKVKFFVITLEE